MKHLLRTATVLLAAALAFGLVTIVGAQETAPHITYFLSADADGVEQVYQLLLDNESEPRQVTHAAQNIITFGAAYDGLSIAYITTEGLWLQPIHTEEAEKLASVSAEQFFSGPVFSQDGQYIAYPDKGVWLLDLATRETRQLLADVALWESGGNMKEFRLYQPEQFVLGQDGKAEKLIVDVGVWEWNTVGVVDLATGDLQELEGQLHTELLPLDDGRVLLYGNGGVAGEPSLHIADSLDDINTYSEVTRFAGLTDATLFAIQAVEIRPGLVRVFGPAISPALTDVHVFTFDYDLIADAATELKFITLSTDPTSSTIPGDISADGQFAPVYSNATWTDEGSIYGDMKLFNLEVGEATAITFPPTVSIFRWQP